MENHKHERWWYRLLQVVYCLFIVVAISIWIIGILAYTEERLSIDYYHSRYHIVCDDGTYRGDFGGSELNYSRTDFIVGTGQEYSRFACSRPDLHGNDLQEAYRNIKSAVSTKYIPVAQRNVYTPILEQQNNIPTERNYKIEILKQEHLGSWWYVFIAIISGLILIPLIFSLIRSTFFYIAFNETFRKTLLFWSKK